MDIRIIHFGGKGQNADLVQFDLQKFNSIRILGGGEVDAIELDGQHYGGHGADGGGTDTLVFTDGEYISSLVVQAQSNEYVRKLVIGTNKGRGIGAGLGGGDQQVSYTGIKVLRIGGMYHDMLDHLDIEIDFDPNNPKPK